MKNNKERIFSMPMKVTEEQISALIANAMGDNCGFEWWKVKDIPQEIEAEEELRSENGEDYCFEDVWSRLLFNGGSLMLLESESDWHWSGHSEDTMLWNWQIQTEGCEPVGGTWHEITLDKLIDGIKLYLQEGVASCCKDLDSIIEDGDFWDADAVFQYAAYGDVIFG